MVKQDSERHEEHRDYLSYFYEPQVTAYEFLKCFFAFLKRKGITEIQRDLSEFLREKKGYEQNKEVLAEINFRSNGINYYSDDIEDALFNLQNGGLLGKMNPSFGIIIIKYTDDEVDKIINNVQECYRTVIENIATDFISTYGKKG